MKRPQRSYLNHQLSPKHQIDVNDLEVPPRFQLEVKSFRDHFLEEHGYFDTSNDICGDLVIGSTGKLERLTTQDCYTYGELISESNYEECETTRELASKILEDIENCEVQKEVSKDAITKIIRRRLVNKRKKDRAKRAINKKKLLKAQSSSLISDDLSEHESPNNTTNVIQLSVNCYQSNSSIIEKTKKKINDFFTLLVEPRRFSESKPKPVSKFWIFPQSPFNFFERNQIIHQNCQRLGFDTLDNSEDAQILNKILLYAGLFVEDVEIPKYLKVFRKLCGTAIIGHYLI